MNAIHKEKPGKILQFLASNSESESPFQPVSVSLEDIHQLRINDGEEFRTWVEALYEEGFIKNPGTHKAWAQEPPWLLALTPKGFMRISSDFSICQVFIAMQFSDTNWQEKHVKRQAVKDSIVGACEELGFVAGCVDDEPHNKKICDQIISLIQQAKFIVADLTGHNNGVYFEVGYAMGMGKEVVFTVHDSEKNDVHFDTRQYNRIHWKTPEELKEKLKAHIDGSIK